MIELLRIQFRQQFYEVRAHCCCHLLQTVDLHGPKTVVKEEWNHAAIPCALFSSAVEVDKYTFLQILLISDQPFHHEWLCILQKNQLVVSVDIHHE